MQVKGMGEVVLRGSLSVPAAKRRVGKPVLGREGSEFPSETHVP